MPDLRTYGPTDRHATPPAQTREVGPADIGVVTCKKAGCKDRGKWVNPEGDQPSATRRTCDHKEEVLAFTDVMVAFPEAVPPRNGKPWRATCIYEESVAKAAERAHNTHVSHGAWVWGAALRLWVPALLRPNPRPVDRQTYRPMDFRTARPMDR